MGVSVLGLLLAFAVFWLADNAAVPWLLHSDWFIRAYRERNEAAVQAYQDYVTEQGFTVRQVQEDRDGRLAEGIYTVMAGLPLSIEVTDKSVSSSAVWDGDIRYSFVWAETAGTEADIAAASEVAVDMYPIQCADGAVHIFAAPAALRYAGLGRVAGLLLALLGFCLVVVPYIVRLLRRIRALSREAEILMAGDLEHSIHVEGRDELSGLGEDIERLRRSVLERIQGEREAVAANSRLITSMSHDLRTPLTKLTGYLDILIYRKYQTQEEHDGFLRMASEKAVQLRTLTGQMLASAQVDAPQSPLEPEAEVVDGGLLLGQLLEEQCGDLRREGFDVRPPAFERDFQLYLSTADAVRIFDNLFSNLKKYADSAVPVRIQAEDGPETVTLRVANRVRPVPDQTDSHGVGVPTMRELLERAGGRLEIFLHGDAYESVLAFPKYRA